MKQKYQIQAVEGVDGLQFLADNPVGRRTYRVGEIVELDDQVHNVKEIMGQGLLRVYDETLTAAQLNQILTDPENQPPQWNAEDITAAKPGK